MTMTTDHTPLTPDTVNAIVRNPDDPRYPSQITVFCDHCGAENTGDYMVSTDMDREQRLAVARQHLVTNEGWEHTADGDDFCPEHAGSPDEEQPAVDASERCAKCKQPFDPADTAFDGRARYHLTPYCRGCVDLCHDTESADHRCVICG
jgi:hypothetical protein